MTIHATWGAVLATVFILFSYEIGVLFAQRRDPAGLARTAHASMREQWFAAISQQPGSEILAVQMLRNALMSATMTASTAALGLVGTVTLATPSLHASFGAAEAATLQLTPRLALELVLMTLLFASLVCSAMAIRYYSHVGFICAMPIGSETRERWAPAAASHLRRAGILYGWGWRNLIMIAPILAAILHPAAGPFVALAAAGVLFRTDRLSAQHNAD